MKRQTGSVHEGKVKKTITKTKKEERFSCDLCSLNFELKGSLTRHKKIVHEEKNTFKHQIDDFRASFRYRSCSCLFQIVV